MSNSKNVYYRYVFKFKDGSTKEFLIELDYETLALIQKEKPSYPEWTELGYHQCPNCPLSKKEYKHCPAAKSLSELVVFFKDSMSFEEADVSVETSGRTYNRHAALQTAISSLMGILMASSGCPILGKMRPMVDSHLPFTSPDETAYRVLSMYLISQYFQAKEGKEADWELAKLVEFLGEIQKVNTAFCDRLNSIRVRDASINAIVNLNANSALMELRLERNRMDRLQKLFKSVYGA